MTKKSSKLLGLIVALLVAFALAMALLAFTGCNNDSDDGGDNTTPSNQDDGTGNTNGSNNGSTGTEGNEDDDTVTYGNEVFEAVYQTPMAPFDITVYDNNVLHINIVGYDSMATDATWTHPDGDETKYDFQYGDPYSTPADWEIETMTVATSDGEGSYIVFTTATSDGGFAGPYYACPVGVVATLESSETIAFMGTDYDVV
ncbi:MAG: hypothetical protein LUD50_08255, partial [Clostridia bacterium]|nr:hypothetical protein [Clostridia bacterium]